MSSITTIRTRIDVFEHVFNVAQTPASLINIDVVILENRPGNRCSVFIRIHFKYGVNFTKTCCVVLNAYIPDCYRGKTFHLFNNRKSSRRKTYSKQIFLQKQSFFIHVVLVFPPKFIAFRVLYFFFYQKRFIVFLFKYHLFYLQNFAFSIQSDIYSSIMYS